MGARNGTGYPLTLRCSKCKVFRRGLTTGTNLRHFSDEKPLTKSQTGNGNARALQYRVKIFCLDCGHSGWSRHRSAARLPLLSDLNSHSKDFP